MTLNVWSAASLLLAVAACARPAPAVETPPMPPPELVGPEDLPEGPTAISVPLPPQVTNTRIADTVAPHRPKPPDGLRAAAAKAASYRFHVGDQARKTEFLAQDVKEIKAALEKRRRRGTIGPNPNRGTRHEQSSREDGPG